MAGSLLAYFLTGESVAVFSAMLALKVFLDKNIQSTAPGLKSSLPRGYPVLRNRFRHYDGNVGTYQFSGDLLCGKGALNPIKQRS